MAEHEIKRALGGKGGEKLHTHSIRYERAHNGGFHAHVEKHTASGEHHHTEHHVLAGPADAAEHMQENMGDQPNIGQAPPDAGAGGSPSEPAPDAGAMAGAAAPPGMG